ncbi:MAG: hypothetical protein WC224_06195 [Sphaerochaetaceae bacterium]
MILIGKQWAFADPGVKGAYFIPTDTKMKSRGTMLWGLATTKSDGITGLIQFNDYVDPKLTYKIEKLQSQMEDPFFIKKKEIAHSEPVGLQEPKYGGASAQALMMQGKTEEAKELYMESAQMKSSGKQRKGLVADSEARYRAQLEVSLVEEEYEELVKKHNELIEDIMTYRSNLLGYTANKLPSRL